MKTEVLIIGAGPVGLLLANLLGVRGVRTLLVERQREPAPQSRAIGITPPSLEILESVGLAGDFARAGVAVRQAVVHGSSRELGRLLFNSVHPRFPFILSIPQQRTAVLLRQAATSYRCVELRNAVHVERVMQTADGVTAECSDEALLHARYAVAADGARSSIALAAGIARKRVSYRAAFFMADFHDRGTFGSDAHLWFTHNGAVESFPLPDAGRRWIVQLPRAVAAAGGQDDIDLEGLVYSRAGVALRRDDRVWQSAFQPERSELARFVDNRLFFAGDAAHTMSPIGGQGMNTGFGDAELLAFTLSHALGRSARNASAGHEPTAARYQRARRKASRAAARRAWAGMRVGTLRGRPFSLLRNAIVSLLMHGAAALLARHFSMQSIPMRSAALALRGKRFLDPRGAHKAGQKIV